MQYPKCKHCNHSKSKHKELNFSQTDDRGYCKDCSLFLFEGLTYEWEYNIDDEWEYNIDDSTKVNCYHSFAPDNLGFIEKLAERRKLV